VRCEGDDRHADRAQGGDGIGRQVGVGTVDDREIRDAGARGGDHLGQVGAAPDDSQAVRA
jgi:hypothetical protein